MRSRLRLVLSLIPLLALAAASSRARAECHDPQPAAAPAPDPARAERLFAEGKQLMKEGKVAEACGLLETSRALDPGGGTVLQLAYCLELTGKLATSYARFDEALQIAVRDRNERRAEIAREHLAALAPRLTRIEIRLSPGAKDHAGLEVRRDGMCVDSGSWEKAIQVDPGKHVITATAPGRTPWQTEIEVIEEGSTTPLTIPPLEPRPVVTPPPIMEPMRGRPPARLEPPPSGSWIPGAVILGAGAVGLGIGAVTGLLATSKASDIEDTCQNDLCPPSQKEQAERAETLAMVSTVGFAAGAALAAAGTVLLVIRPFGRGATQARVTAGLGSVGVGGSF